MTGFGDFDEIPLDDIGPCLDDSWRTPAGIAARDQIDEAIRAAAPRPREIRFGRISFGELRTRKARAPDFIIDDWMVAREISFLAGESQSGKSFLALHAGMCIATGQDVFGRATAPGLVIYQAGESGTGVTDRRIPGWVQHYGSSLPEQVPFEILTHKIDLWSPEGSANRFIDAIGNIAAEYAPVPLRAVFIDTLSKAMSGANENDGRDVGRVLANAETIARATGAHVCIVHHFSKNAKQMRGHGSMRGDVDAVALLHVDEATKVRTLTFDKMKDGERGSKLQFELKQVRLGEDDRGRDITSCVVVPVNEKAARRAAADASASARVTSAERVVLEAFFKALDESGGPPPAGLDCNPNLRVVDYAEVRRVYGQMSPLDTVEQFETEEAREDAERKHRARLKTRLQRAREFMTNNTRILAFASCPDPVTGKPADFCWWTGRPVLGFARTQPPKPKDEEPPEALKEPGDWIDRIL